MRLVENVAEVYEALQTAKQPGRSFVTNFFPSRPKLESWIGRRELSLAAGERGAFLLRRDADFSHLYFLAADLEGLRPSLSAFLVSEPGTIVADLLGREDEVGTMEDALADNGFSRYARLIRVSREAASPAPAAIEPGVEHAEPADAAAITAMLHNAFDRYAEQLPVQQEIREAAANRSILVVRSAEAIAGLLFFETYGLTSVLRYWLVDPGSRNQRVGARLIRSYFASCQSVKLFNLWVLSDNKNAMARYRNYGYAPDGLIDQVMIRRLAAAGPAQDRV
jgi:predicted N-acetyltransferase YhbS